MLQRGDADADTPASHSAMQWDLFIDDQVPKPQEQGWRITTDLSLRQLVANRHTVPCFLIFIPAGDLIGHLADRDLRPPRSAKLYLAQSVNSSFGVQTHSCEWSTIGE